MNTDDYSQYKEEQELVFDDGCMLKITDVTVKTAQMIQGEVEQATQ